MLNNLCRVLLISLALISHGLLAQLPAVEISQLADNVYMHRSFKDFGRYGVINANGLILIDEQSAFLIDTPWDSAQTQQVLDWLHSQRLTLVGAFATHAHDDRAGGFALLNQMGIATYATALTQAQLQKQHMALASNVITDDASLGFADARVYYPGAGHSADNQVVWLPNSHILFAGCISKDAQAKGLGSVKDADMAHWPVALQNLLQRFGDARLVVPGHNDPGDAGVLQHTIELLTAR